MLFGIHDFINSQPLLGPLMKRASEAGFEIRTGSPAQLAEQLSDGKLDMAMIPAIEYLKQADQLRLLPDISISSRNKVGTVLLVSKVPLNAIRSLALDNRSRTSVALLRILYSKVFPAELKFSREEPDAEKMLSQHDAALIIGDQALGFSKEGASIYDLSEEWFKQTEKTFVHAVIAVREGIKVDITQTLMDAKQEGLHNLDRIAQAQEKITGHSTVLLLDYLRNKIRYDFGQEEMEGLMHFQSLCHEADLVPKKFPLRFV
ncbi:MAG: menaquinone biosynthesis protein [Nitrospina sp.]|nr:menaquinone biosynthesis protein [Nitrospina sp.]MBT5633386.1 menaquinone biosynthesis protein [Nitrospina sp.]